MVLCPRKQFRFVAHIAWFVNMRQHVEKLSFFAKSMHWISGPSPSPQVTQRDGALDKKALILCCACTCVDLGQCAQDHYDSGVLAELLMRETIKKWAKANFPLFCNTYTLSYD